MSYRDAESSIEQICRLSKDSGWNGGAVTYHLRSGAAGIDIVRQAQAAQPLLFKRWSSGLCRTAPWSMTDKHREAMDAYLVNILRPLPALSRHLTEAASAIAVLYLPHRQPVIQWLIEAGLDIHAPDPNNGGMSVFAAIADSKDSEVTLKWFLEEHDGAAHVEQVDDRNWRALDWAAMNGYQKPSLLLIEAGSDPDRPIEQHGKPRTTARAALSANTSPEEIDLAIRKWIANHRAERSTDLASPSPGRPRQRP